MAAQARIVAGNKILSQPLPALLTREHYRTTSSALHETWYDGPLQDWQIESEAWKLFEGKDLNDPRFSFDSLQEALSQGQGYPVPINREQFVCGEESSVCGRFVQNALTPVTAVAFANRILSRFSDFKSCAEGSKSPEANENKNHYIPDFVAIQCQTTQAHLLKTDVTPHMILAGEGKTEWVHNFVKWYKSWKNKKPGEAIYFRKALGQLAEYMHVYKVRYGFLTNYDYTIFVRQDYTPDETGIWKAHLRVSRPIHRNDIPSETPQRLSVRQCLYYLLYLTKDPGSYRFDNPVPLDVWIGIRKDAKNQQNDPHTPYRGQLDTPQKAISAMSPELRIVTDSYTPLELYESGGKWTVIMNFDHDQIKNNHVLIDGKPIRVKLMSNNASASNADSGGHAHDHAHLGNNNYNNYDYDKGDHGLTAVTSNLGGLNLNSTKPLAVPSFPKRAGGSFFLQTSAAPLIHTLPKSRLSEISNMHCSPPDQQTPTPAARTGRGPLQQQDLTPHPNPLPNKQMQAQTAPFRSDRGQQQGPASRLPRPSNQQAQAQPGHDQQQQHRDPDQVGRSQNQSHYRTRQDRPISEAEWAKLQDSDIMHPKNRKK